MEFFLFSEIRTLHNYFPPQIVEEVKQFYEQTYAAYQSTKQPALKETLTVIQLGVSLAFYVLFSFFFWGGLKIYCEEAEESE